MPDKSPRISTPYIGITGTTNPTGFEITSNFIMDIQERESNVSKISFLHFLPLYDMSVIKIQFFIMVTLTK